MGFAFLADEAGAPSDDAVETMDVVDATEESDDTESDRVCLVTASASLTGDMEPSESDEEALDTEDSEDSDALRLRDDRRRAAARLWAVLEWGAIVSVVFLFRRLWKLKVFK